MNMKRVIIILTAILVGFTSCKKKVVWVSPTTAPVTEAVFAPGHIEAGNQFTLTALNDGYITGVPVTEGDTVTAGQIVFKQDNTTATIQQRSATESLGIARTNASENSAVLAELQEQLRTAGDKLGNDKIQRDRMERLYATGSVAKVDYDNAVLAYKSSLNNVAAIQQNMAATRLSLQQSLVNSRSQQEVAAVTTGYYNIKSPGNYTVYTLLKKKGDLVRKGDALAVLGQPGGMLISLSVDESSIAKIKLGQIVLTTLNTDKSRMYTGQVSKIYPSFDEQSQSYTIEAVFDTLPAHLLNGTLLQSNIIVAKKDKALLVPAGCVSPDGKVIVKRGRKEDTVQVQTGIVATDWIEIRGGVSTADQLQKAF